MVNLVEITLENLLIPLDFQLADYQLVLTFANNTGEITRLNQHLTFLVSSFDSNLEIALVSRETPLGATQVRLGNLLSGRKKISETFTLNTDMSTHFLRDPIKVVLGISAMTDPQGDSYSRCRHLQVIIQNLQKELMIPNRVVQIDSQQQFSSYQQFQILKKRFQQKLKNDQVLEESNRKLSMLLASGNEARQELQKLVQESSEQVNSKVSALHEKIRFLINENSAFQAEMIQEQQKISMLNYETSQLKRSVSDKEKEIQKLKQKLQRAVKAEKDLRESVKPTKSPASQQYETVIQKLKELDEQKTESLEYLKTEKTMLENTILSLKTQVNAQISSRNQMKVFLQDSLNSEKSTVAEKSVQISKLESELVLKKSDIEYAQMQNKILQQENKRLHSQLTSNIESNTQFRKQLEQNIIKLENDLNLSSFQNSRLSKEYQAIRSEYQSTKIQAELQISKALEASEQIKTYYQNYVSQLRQETQNIQTEVKLRLIQAQKKYDSIKTENSDLCQNMTILNNKVADQAAVIGTMTKQKQQFTDQLEIIKQSLAIAEDIKKLNSDLKEENQVHKREVQRVESEIKSMNDLLSVQTRKSEESHTLVQQLHAEIFEARSQVERLKIMNTTLQANAPRYIPVKTDSIDLVLAEFVNSRSEPLQVSFIREDSGVYLFGMKKVFIKLDNEALIVRIGGGFMPIHEFIEMYTSMEVEKMKTKDEKYSQAAKNLILGKFAQNMVQSSNLLGDLSPKHRTSLLSPNNEGETQKIQESRLRRSFTLGKALISKGLN